MARNGQTERVVVGVDGSPSSLAALEWAADYAARAGGTLEMVSAWDWPHSYGWAVPLPEGYDPSVDAQGLLDRSQALVRERHPDLEASGVVAQGHPALVLVKASEHADLLVVGSRGHGEFAGMLLGSVSEHCVTNAHCPVLVYRREAPQD